jgi:hypothetical protein
MAEMTEWERRLSIWLPVVVSTCAISLTLYGGCQDRHFRRLSVRPELGIEFRTGRDWNGWTLGNSGLGPARVRWFSVTLDGQPKTEWAAVKAALPLPRGEFTFTDPYPETIIGQGEQVRLFGFPGDYPERARLRAAAPRLAMSICYCSLYEECFRAGSASGYIHKESCRRPPPGAFLGAE